MPHKHWQNRLKTSRRRVKKWTGQRSHWKTMEKRAGSKGWATRYRRKAERAAANLQRAQHDRERAWSQVKPTIQKRVKPVRPRRRVARFEYVLKVDYRKRGRKRSDRGHDVFYDVRMVKGDYEHATAAELRSAARYLKERGIVPAGWSVQGVAWGPGRREDVGEPTRRGGMGDVESLSATLYSAKVDWNEVGEEER